MTKSNEVVIVRAWSVLNPRDKELLFLYPSSSSSQSNASDKATIPLLKARSARARAVSNFVALLRLSLKYKDGPIQNMCGNFFNAKALEALDAGQNR